MKKLTIFLLFPLVAAACHAPDPAQLFFQHKQVALPTSANPTILSDNGLRREILINIGNHKFLYESLSANDSLPVAIGQLGLYKTTMGYYLLREGVWVIEDGNETVQFANTGTSNLVIDEMEVAPGGSVDSEPRPGRKKTLLRKAERRER